MTLNPSSSANEPVRIGGFYSSFDTQAVVKALAAVAHAPIDSMQKRQDALQQKSLVVARLQTEIAALLSNANKLLLPNSVSGKTTSVTGSGVTASAASNATPGSFTVSVLQIATSTKATGSPLTAALDASSPLAAANLGNVVTAGTFTIKTPQGTAVLTVDPVTQSLGDVIAAINAEATTTGVTASLKADATGQLNLLDLQSTGGPIQLGTGADTSNFLAATKLLASPGTVERTSTLAINRLNPAGTLATASFSGGPPASGAHSFTINGVRIDYDASSDSLSSVLARINTSGAGVKASYDVNSDSISLTQNALGSIGIQLADDSTGGDFLARTGLLDALQTPGQNAQYSVNGGLTLHATSNNVDLGNGLSLTLLAPTGATPVTVTVAQDNTAAAANLGSFVKDYNTLIQDLATVTKADRTAPGPMSGDANLISLQSRLRALITNPGTNITGRFGQLASIGLSFG
ncbi:MAG TPA: flagellar filament capping protein FliD, partial [Gemmatimonadales bacterium]|nr:flagellar filament capping protein FliD [Gemmatimonadales bacterium]